MLVHTFSGVAAAVIGGILFTALVQPASADVSEAKKIVADAMKPPANFVGAGPAFDANKVAGKTLWYISFSEQSPVMATWSGTMQRLIQSYGGKVNIVDGKSNFSEFGRLIEQAVANGADAIVLMGIPPQAFGVQVQQAKDAKIPVIVGSNGVAAIPDMNGVVAAVTIDHVQVGKLLGAWVVADTNGKGQAALVTHDEVMGTKTRLLIRLPARSPDFVDLRAARKPKTCRLLESRPKGKSRNLWLRGILISNTSYRSTTSRL